MRSGLVVAAAAVTLAALVVAYRFEPSEPAPATPLVPARVSASPEPIPPEHMPPPFRERDVQRPDPEAPAPSETAAFCDESQWSGLDLVVGQNADGEFRVDIAAWERALTDTKAGIANWMSLCRRDGGAVTIVGDATGATLATYDPTTGLRLSRR
jgi:hypothetical protein